VIRRAEGASELTGLLTVDGLLNGRPDITLDALRHLVLPVLTLSFAQWATLGRVMRATMMETRHSEYAVAAQARGLPGRRVLWRHAFRNAIGPALTHSALAAATLRTGVFVVEVIVGLNGASEVITAWANDPFAAQRIPDTAAMLGFAVYSVLAVQLLMLGLDVLHVLFTPRLREDLDSL
jgi:peptide/nickel transport system permease protein